MTTQAILWNRTLKFAAPVIPAILLCAWSSHALAAQTLAIDGKGTGRIYDGMGAISGGGATSVLLQDYVEPQRSQIMDLLFKPNFGAAMQELYIEIGGDGNSTQGSELSHMHSRTDENYYRGYEWFVMEQARCRNPSILLDACAWSAPGWVGNGNFWSQDTADYLAKWTLGAKSAHNLNIDFLGCRNEKGLNVNWVKTFRSTLDKNGLKEVKIHAFDNWQDEWAWIPGAMADPEVNNAVYAFGNHTTLSTPPPGNVQALNKPIWDTEEHVYEHGFPCLIDNVKAVLENYLKGKVTKTIFWYAVTSYYSIEPFFDQTMMVADQPWSGNYRVNPALWSYAHLGQFTQPGWRFIDAATVYLTGGGAVASFVSPSGTDYSIVAETAGAKAAQSITVTLSGGLSTGTVSVWRSNATEQFIKQADITPTNGSFTLELEANAVYSLTTTTGQQKGTVPAPPAAAPFPLPYYENYDHYADFKKVGYRAYYHSDIAGAFELADRADGKGKCLHQAAPQAANSWAPESDPYTVLGDTGWTDIEASVDVSIEKGGWAGLMGHVNSTGNGYGTNPGGYTFTLTSAGAWTFSGGGKGQATLKAGDWHNLKLVFTGKNIKGSVDDTQVFSVDTGGGKGCVGLAAQKGTSAFYDNLIVKAVGAADPTPTVFAQDTQNAACSAGTPGVDGGTSSGHGGNSGGGGAGSSVSQGAGGAGGPAGSGSASSPAGSGGFPGSAGNSAAGGAGGLAGSGGAGGTGTTGTGSANNGCSCNLGQHGQRGMLGLLVAAVFLIARRRRIRP